MDKHNSEQFEIIGADFDLAEKIQLENNKIGTGRFYAELTEQNRTEQEALIQQNCHQTQEDVMELLESQLHSSIDSVQNNSRLSGLTDILCQKNSLLEEELPLMENRHMQEFWYKEKNKCNGVIGVPITFLDKYCADQFEIIGSPDANVLPVGWKGASKKFVEEYYKQGNTGQYNEGNRLACYFTNNGEAKVPFKRILIKRKENIDDSKNI